MKKVKQLGKYRLVRKLGRDDVGIACVVEDVESAEELELRVLEEPLSERRLYQVKRVANLSLITPVDAGSEQDVHYAVYRTVEASSVWGWVRDHGPFSPGDAAHVARTLSLILKLLHADRVTHGNVHPGQVFVSPDGHVLLAGLAVVRPFEKCSAAVDWSEFTAPGVSGPLGPTREADVYGIGAVLCFLLTGGTPEDFATDGLPPDVPEGLGDVVSKLLDDDPKLRLRDCGQVAQALNETGVANAVLEITRTHSDSDRAQEAGSGEHDEGGSRTPGSSEAGPRRRGVARNSAGRTSTTKRGHGRRRTRGSRVSAEPKPTAEAVDTTTEAGSTVASRPWRRLPVVLRWVAALSVLAALGAGNAFVLLTSDLPIPVEERGFRTRVYVDSEGTEHTYAVFVPHEFERDRQLPVLLFLNGRGENGTDGVMQVQKNFGPPIWEIKRHFPFLVVMPQCRNNNEFWSGSGSNARVAMEILNEAVREYDGDPDRVYLTGLSSGGDGVWELASLAPKRFAAIVPMCSGHHFGTAASTPEELARILVEAELPVWSFVNRGDRRPATRHNALHTAMIEYGASPRLTEYPRRGHECWVDAYRSPALWSWLLRQSRAERTPADWRLLLKDDLGGWNVPANRETWNVDGTVLGMTPAPGREATRLETDASFSEFEFALEWRIPKPAPKRPAPEFRLRFRDPSSGDFWELQMRVPEQGGSVLVSPSGRVHGLDPLAERALVRDTWNDVRVSMHQEHVQVELNGWKALDVTSESHLGNSRVMLKVDHATKEHAWRNLRVRRL